MILAVLIVLIPHGRYHLRDVAGDLGLAVAVMDALDFEQEGPDLVL
jgi:hypothetical protein